MDISKIIQAVNDNFEKVYTFGKPNDFILPSISFNDIVIIS